MKRISLSLATALLLAACSSQQTVTYRLAFDVTDPKLQQELTQISMEVIERRLGHLGVQMLDRSADASKPDAPLLTIVLPDKESADALTGELTAPFSLTVMAEAAAGEKADITIEGRGGFTDTGINEDDFEWVEARKDPASNKGEVGMALTADGQKKMQALFSRMKGKSIGIFVRNKLVSLLKIETDKVPTTLVIHDVPSPDIARIFADDMDVGLHVTFTPVP